MRVTVFLRSPRAICSIPYRRSLRLSTSSMSIYTLIQKEKNINTINMNVFTEFSSNTSAIYLAPLYLILFPRRLSEMSVYMINEQ
jgi:hypothetical protein